MKRRERRLEMRQIIKELGVIKNTKLFIDAMNDEAFAKIVKNNIASLRDGTYPDTDILFRYGSVISLIQNANALEERLNALLKKEKGIPYVKQT
jgi:hypothetical protein